MKATWAVAVKELRQIRRDRRTLVILVFVPTFFLFLYGYALNFDIRHVSMAVEDRDSSEESRQLIAAFERSSYFDIVAGDDVGPRGIRARRPGHGPGRARHSGRLRPLTASGRNGRRAGRH
jgi:hypothetical protein